MMDTEMRQEPQMISAIATTMGELRTLDANALVRHTAEDDDSLHGIDNPSLDIDEDDNRYGIVVESRLAVPMDTYRAPAPGPSRDSTSGQSTPRDSGSPRGSLGFVQRDGNRTPEDKSKTVVSFVLDEEGGAEKEDDDDDDCTRNSTYTWTVLGSVLYATILVLLGLAFPVAEALRGQWLRSQFIAVFLTYLYLGSSIFIVFLQIEMYLARRKEVKTGKARGGRRSSDFGQHEMTENNKPLPKDILLLKLQKQLNSSANTTMSNTMESSLNESSFYHEESGEFDQPPRRMNGQNRNNNLVTLTAPDGTQFERSPSLKRTSQVTPPPSPYEHQACGISSKSLEDAVNQLSQSGARERTRRVTLCSEDQLSLATAFDQDSDVNDAIFEQMVLLKQTATFAHEGAGFYLRLGCLLFGIGNFIFLVLELDAYTEMDEECDFPIMYPKFFQLAFLLLQTFFLFKNSKIQQVRRYKGLIRFGLLHTLVTNLDTWLRVLVEEVAHAFAEEGHNGHPAVFAGSVHGNSSCDESAGLLRTVSPYLYPFILEYSLIAVATMAGMYHSLNLHIPTDMLRSLKRLIRKSSQSTAPETPEQNHESFTVFAKSHRGMYAGIILLTATITSIIFFYFNKDNEDQTTAAFIYYYSDISIQTVLLMATVAAIVKLRGFKFTFSRDNKIDDILLMLSLSGLILLNIFIFVAAFSALTGILEGENFHDHNAILALASAIVAPLQALIQAAFIIDSLQRCPRNGKQQREKPGRGVLTFLILGNLSLWIFKTFQLKEIGVNLMEEYYGSIAWVLIENISLPLLLFYRFHSSVCLADIWVSAYEPEHGPQYKLL